jgi:rare lipoprotein A
MARRARLNSAPRQRPPVAARAGIATAGLLLAVVLAGCASGPRSTSPSVSPGVPPSGPATGRDGPDANPPPALEQVPDAEPRVEPLRIGGPNKPYEVLGESYTPITADKPLRELGLASWYGRKFHGRPTSSGELYDMYAMTAAHKTMPLPSYARVRNPANGREIVVRVNDRGPFHPGRVIDLSYTAALKLGVLNGVAPVEVERLTHDEIRAGVWRRSPAPAEAAVGATPAAGAAASALLASQDVPLPALPVTAAAVPSAPIAKAPPAGFWLQLGAFRERENAGAMHRQVQRAADWLAPMLAVFAERSVYRVQAGPFASRSEAQGVAERLQSVLNAVPLVTERR